MGGKIWAIGVTIFCITICTLTLEWRLVEQSASVRHRRYELIARANAPSFAVGLRF